MCDCKSNWNKCRCILYFLLRLKLEWSLNTSYWTSYQSPSLFLRHDRGELDTGGTQRLLSVASALHTLRSDGTAMKSLEEAVAASPSSLSSRSEPSQELVFQADSSSTLRIPIIQETRLRGAHRPTKPYTLEPRPMRTVSPVMEPSMTSKTALCSRRRELPFKPRIRPPEMAELV